MDAGDIITLVFSLLGVALGGAAFYREFLYAKRELLFRPLSIVGDDGAQSIQVAVINSGTRAMAVTSITLAYWSIPDIGNPGWVVGSSEDTPSEAAPVVVNAGEIKIVPVPIRHNPEDFYESGMRFRKTGARPAWSVGDDPDVPAALLYSVLDDAGRRWKSSRAVGTIYSYRNADKTMQRLWMDFSRQYSGLAQVSEGIEIAMEVRARVLPDRW